MNKILISDNASTTLAAGIAPNSPSLQVVAGSGALFPVLGTNQAFICTLIKSGSPTIREVIEVQGHTSGSDNFTNLIRNLSATGALSWNAGDILEMRPTAETFATFAQLLDVQFQQNNFALDTGQANAYVVKLNVPLFTRSSSTPLRFKANNANTGDSTITDDIGTAPLRKAARPSGQSALLPNDIVAGGIYTAFWDGTVYQLQPRTYFDLISGQLANTQVPFSVVAQWESLLVLAFSQLTGQLQNGQIAANIALPGSPTTTTQGVGDSATRIATTAFVNPASLLGTNGFFKRADGHILQAGQCNPNGGLITVTLPQAFPNAFQAVVGNSTGRPTQCNCVIASNSQFTISNTGGQSYWMAMGY